jgi:predicted lysophospholipase L1 biosynthesis ABC-type transport system permease subunit
VRQYLRGRSPIGVRIETRSSPTSRPTVREVVGVARQVKQRPDETAEMLQIHVPLAQAPVDDMFLLVRTAQQPEALAPAVRAAISRVDKEQLVSVRDVRTLEDVRAQATSRYRFRAVLVMAFAALALTLAMVGVFGMLAYSVQQRVREVGVRRALGATSVDVFRLLAGSAARVIGAGLAIGLALSVVAGRFLSSMLFNVEPLDALTFAVVPLVLFVTALLSAAAPMWRAARIDPAAALHAVSLHAQRGAASKRAICNSIDVRRQLMRF